MGYDWRLLFFITTGLCFIAGTITLTHFTKISSDNTLHKGSRPEISFISVSLAAIMGIYVAGEVLLSSRMAFYLENALHLDKVEAANYLSYFFASLLSGRLLTTISPIRLKSIGWPIGLMFCAALIYFLGSYHHPLFFCLTGFFIGPVFPLILTWMRNQFGEQADAIIPTAMNGVSIGVIVLHVVVGKLSSSIGISVIFESGPVIFLISALILAAVAYCASKNQERNRL
jgi:fucose permease